MLSVPRTSLSASYNPGWVINQKPVEITVTGGNHKLYRISPKGIFDFILLRIAEV